MWMDENGRLIHTFPTTNIIRMFVSSSSIRPWANVKASKHQPSRKRCGHVFSVILKSLMQNTDKKILHCHCRGGSGGVCECARGEGSAISPHTHLSAFLHSLSHEFESNSSVHLVTDSKQPTYGPLKDIA